MTLIRTSRLALSRGSRATFVSRSLQTSSSVHPLYPDLPVYSYSIGLSYAAKYSPPFINPKQDIKPYGFAKQSNDVGKWVQQMLELTAGRGDLKASEEDLAEARRRWGAGEDFFGITNARGDVRTIPLLASCANLIVRSCTSQSQTVSAAGPTELTLLCFLNYYATIMLKQLKN